jgi:hypothetical protein
MAGRRVRPADIQFYGEAVNRWVMNQIKRCTEQCLHVKTSIGWPYQWWLHKSAGRMLSLMRPWFADTTIATFRAWNAEQDNILFVDGRHSDDYYTWYWSDATSMDILCRHRQLSQ